MAQKRTPTTFSGLLVSDARNPVSKTLNPQPSASDAAIAEIQSDRGALLVSRLTTDRLTSLKDTHQAVNGMIAYDSDKKKFVFFQEDDWVVIPDAAVEHYVEGPDASEDGDMVVFGEKTQRPQKSSGSFKDDPQPAHLVKGPLSSIPGNVAVFKDETGSEIADSGLTIQKITRLQGLSAQDLLQLTNLGALQFVKELGVILVDDLIPVTFYTRGKEVEAQVCTVFGGDLPAESSSESALVEINSTTGALLVSRMTTAQRKALQNPQNGMIVYDKDLKSFLFYQKGAWAALSTGNGDVIGPDLSLKGEIPIFDDETGKRMGGSGVLIDDAQKMTSLKNMRISTPQPYDKNYSLWADSGIVAWDYFVTSSGKFKTVLGRDDEIHDEVESLWNALSFVRYTRHHDPHHHQRFGLIAEEVADVAPHWVEHHDEGMVLNKSALLECACVMIQKLIKDNKILKKQAVSQERKLDHFIKVFNLRAKKNGFAPIDVEEE
jgi:hypothetical protein